MSTRNIKRTGIRRRFTALLGVATSALLLASGAAGAEPTALAASVTPAELPAGAILGRRVGNLLVTATADGRLITYDVSTPSSPRKLAARDAGGQVLALRVADGVVFAVIAERRVLALVPAAGGKLVAWRPAARGTGAAAGGATAAAVRAEVVVGQISKVRYGSVLVKLHAIGMVKPGDTLLVRSRRRTLRHNLFSGRAEQVISNAPVALLEVRQVRGAQAVADLARGDRAAVGDAVERVKRSARRSWGSRLLARRAAYQQWVRGTVRPFLNFGRVDVGSLTDLSWGFQRDALLVQARVAPLGVSVPYGVDAVNAYAVVSYNTDVAAFGVGGGYWRHHFQARDRYSCDDSGFVAGAADVKGGSTPEVPPVFNCKQSGPSVVQHLRLGSVDGLNLELFNALAIQDGEFRFGYLEGHLDIPVTRTLNLYGAGGGSTGIKWGEVGVRTYLRGVGGPETFILSTGLGGTSMRTKTLYDVKYDTYPGSTTKFVTNEERSVGGLHITVGLEYRY